MTIWNGPGDNLRVSGPLELSSWMLPSVQHLLQQTEHFMRTLYPASERARLAILEHNQWQWCWPALVLASTHASAPAWLDIGPGHGTLLYALHTMGYKVYGIDRQPIIRGSLRTSVRQMDMLVCQPEQLQSWIHGPVLAVSLTQVLEHIPYNPQPALKVILDTVRPRYLLVSTPHSGFPDNWQIQVHWRELPSPPENLAYPDRHYKYYEEEELMELFDALHYTRNMSRARSSTRIVIIGEVCDNAE